MAKDAKGKAENISAAKIVQPFVCGGISACLASCIIHPIDLAKVQQSLITSYCCFVLIPQPLGPPPAV